MAMLPSKFKAKDHGDMGTFDPLPAGIYNCKIVESELKLTKKAEEEGDPSLGQYLNCKFEVLDGTYKGRTFFKNFNLVNKNEKAVEIANKEFATLCRATGVLAPEDSAELHGVPVEVHLRQKGKETDAYGIQNEVKLFKEYSGEAVPESSEESAKPAGGKKRNW